MNRLSYEQARERVERFLERDHGGIGPLGHTLVFDHGRRTDRATLLFHGLSASPHQFVDVARELHARGHNVLVPRLPRHGYADRLSEALAAMSARQLKACALASLQMAQGLGDRVCIGGFSLGGLLSVYLSQLFEVERMVAVSPFLGVSFVPNMFRLQLANWVLRRPNRFHWWDPLLRERQLPAHGYPRYATHAVAQGLTLAHEVLEASVEAAPEGRDLVIVVNAREPAVNNRAIMQLVANWTLHGAAVRVHRLSGLPIAHDIIEPKRYPQVAAQVTPVIVGLIDR